MESTPPDNQRVWPILRHPIAWGVVLAVGVAFVAANVREKEELYIRASYKFKSGHLVKVHSYGWPIFYPVSKKLQSGTTIITEPNLLSVPLIVNVVVGLLFVVATSYVFVIPLWQRRKRFQVKLETLFILTATVAVFCALYRVAEPFFAIITPPHDDPINRFFFTFPLGLGIGCTIYMGLWLTVRLVTAPVKILAKRRAAPSE